MLKDGTLTNGRELWQELIDVVRNARLGAGAVEIESLIQNLSQHFALKDHPSYASSWLALEADTATYKKNIESALPNMFVIEAVAEVISQNALSVLYGESGSGKSALVKTVLDQKFADWRQVWFGPDQFAAGLKYNERAKLGLMFATLNVCSAVVAIMMVAHRALRMLRHSHSALVSR